MARIELKNICKRFDQPNRLSFAEIINPFALAARLSARMTADPLNRSFCFENLNFTIPDGKVMVILGPSGCGKSTLLRLIAGLMPPDAGEILYDGVNVAQIPPGERQIGMVFQNYALYPHFTAKGNILSYFRFKKHTPALDAAAQERYRKTSELLGVEIEYLLDKKPTHLSGGEKQRVALGRCITRDPALFLLDEPFSNLDQKLREKYRGQLKKLLRNFAITTVYVTHDQQEALILADAVTIMNVGRIEQVGTPAEIYHQPHNLFVAEFLNLDADTPAINLLEGGVVAPALQDFLVGVRSEDIALCDEHAADGLSGVITDVRQIPLKQATILVVRLGKNEISMRLPLTPDVANNSKIRVRFRKYHCFDKHSGQRVRTYPAESSN